MKFCHLKHLRYSICFGCRFECDKQNKTSNKCERHVKVSFQTFLFYFYRRFHEYFFKDTNIEFSAPSSCSDRILMVWELLLKKYCISLSKSSLNFLKIERFRTKRNLKIKIMINRSWKWFVKMTKTKFYNLNFLPFLLRHISVILWFYVQSTFHSSERSHRISLLCSCHKNNCKY